MPPGETPDLGALCSDYAMKVLDVNESDNAQIRGVAVAVAARVSEDESQFKKFAVASRSRRDLQGWLRRQAVDHVRYSKEPEPFITERQWLLLFDSADQYLHRDLLLIAVLEEVQKLDPKWRRDDPDARKEADSDLDTPDEEGTGDLPGRQGSAGHHRRRAEQRARRGQHRRGEEAAGRLRHLPVRVRAGIPPVAARLAACRGKPVPGY
jgi:hypothetical protein